MFTGIITHIGTVSAVETRGDKRFWIDAGGLLVDVAVGASICCSGVCLTAVNFDDTRFAVDVSAETVSRTTLGDWQVGTPVNLERSLKMGDELGGHLVSGHVDGVATITDRRSDGDSIRFMFTVPAGNGLAPMLAEKGSVAVDGVSLTVNAVSDLGEGAGQFEVNIIPHTLTATTLGARAVGERVHIEVDPLARYVARQLAAMGRV
jgi:riboflavin synthase